MKAHYAVVLSFLFISPEQASAVSVYSENFAAPSSTTWNFGNGVPINTSVWSTYTNGNFGSRINGGRLEINSRRSSSAHGQGFAYVECGGATSQFNNSVYNPVLGDNGALVTWTFNMRKAPSNATSNGGFSCSSSQNQNGVTIGLGFILGTNSASGILSSTSNCNPNGTSVGYAVLHGGNNRIRLVRFQNSIHNGTITNIAESQTLTYAHYHSVRVTFDPNSNTWTLAVRSDGANSFTDPAAGSYVTPSTGVDATHTGIALNYMGGYFQAGCIGNCDDASSGYIALFDNVNVDVACVPPTQPGPIAGVALVCPSTVGTYSIDPVSGVQDYVWTYSGSDVVLTPSGTSVSLTFGPASTSGVLSVVSVGECNSNSSTLPIVVQTLPAAPSVLAESVQPCAGSVAIFSVTAVPGESYAWTLPAVWTGDLTGDSVNVTVAAPGGTISVVATNSCGSGPAATFDVVVEPLPNVSLAAFPMVCISTAPFQLTGGSPAGGVYAFNGVPAVSFNPIVGLGSYTITYTVVDSNGCSATATQELVVDACAGIDEAAQAVIRTFPNPVIGDILYFEAPSSGELTLFDAAGRAVMYASHKATGSPTSLELQDLSGGSYTLLFRGNNGNVAHSRIVLPH